MRIFMRYLVFSLLLSLVACDALNTGNGYNNGGYYDPYSNGYGNNGYNSGYNNGYYNSQREQLERERLRLERERLQMEKDRVRQEQANRKPNRPSTYTPPPRRETCPSGFRPSEQKCSPKERKHGCQDMRLPGGLGCVRR